MNSGDIIEFSVFGESGNIIIGCFGVGILFVGILIVYGDILFDRNLIVNGFVIILGNVSSDVLMVNVDVIFNDDVIINGDNFMFIIEV